MSEKLPILYHHGDMLGFIQGTRRHPGLYFRDKYIGMVNITDEEAVEIYMTEVIVKPLLLVGDFLEEKSRGGLRNDVGNYSHLFN